MGRIIDIARDRDAEDEFCWFSIGATGEPAEFDIADREDITAVELANEVFGASPSDTFRVFLDGDSNPTNVTWDDVLAFRAAIDADNAHNAMCAEPVLWA